MNENIGRDNKLKEENRANLYEQTVIIRLP